MTKSVRQSIPLGSGRSENPGRPARATAGNGLDTPIRYLKGVGPNRAACLGQVGIDTVGDLLDFFPRRHEYSEDLTPIDQLAQGQQATVAGQIVDLGTTGRAYRPTVVALIEDHCGACQVRWFNSRYLLDKLEVGQWIRVFGKVRVHKFALEFTNPRYELFSIQQYDAMALAKSYPVYSACGELSAGQVPKLVRQALLQFGHQIVEHLPARLLAGKDLMGRRQAYQAMHNPQQEVHWEAARQRLAYDELLVMQLAIGLRRHRRASGIGAISLNCNAKIDQRISRRFPFELTAAQKRVIGQVVADLAKPIPMNRLLQGDVGSGKTAVAVYAALVTIASRAQVAFMAPTGILAQQHYGNISSYLAGSRVRCELLTGSMSNSARREILAATAAGEVDMLIGTQALLQGDVEFRRLGLVIVDEQHKFGVLQRATIRSKGTWPHYLVMTATPIPRSLALTVFGDLDVSIIDQLPPGRVAVKTMLFEESDHKQAYQFVQEQLQAGNQGYIVYPLLDPSDKLQLKAASRQAKQLAGNQLSKFRVGLIHGQMSSAAKNEVMDQFRQGLLDVLVATVVIEVGLDVPAANLLVVENAQRFGLSQLHQLRGRIGRAGQQGYCLLIASAGTVTSRQRLNALLETSDGFRIAEEDLRLRGPGRFSAPNSTAYRSSR